MYTLIIGVLWFWCLWGCRGGAITNRSTSDHEAVIGDFTVDESMTVKLQERLQNHVTLTCRNGSTVLDRRSADFWVIRGSQDSVPEDLQSIGVPYHYPRPNKAQINFTMTPDIEGHFFCGNISAMIRSANNLTLIGMLYVSQARSQVPKGGGGSF